MAARILTAAVLLAAACASQSVEAPCKARVSVGGGTYDASKAVFQGAAVSYATGAEVLHTIGEFKPLIKGRTYEFDLPSLPASEATAFRLTRFALWRVNTQSDGLRATFMVQCGASGWMTYQTREGATSPWVGDLGGLGRAYALQFYNPYASPEIEVTTRDCPSCSSQHSFSVTLRGVGGASCSGVHQIDAPEAGGVYTFYADCPELLGGRIDSVEMAATRSDASDGWGVLKVAVKNAGDAPGLLTWERPDGSSMAWLKSAPARWFGKGCPHATDAAKDAWYPSLFQAYQRATVLGMAVAADNIPTAFCWKKGGDAGTVPVGCVSGWTKQGAMCYKNCRSGYKLVAGTCWKRCQSGYDDHGATCYKNIVTFYFKRSYVTTQKTFFSSKARCPAYKYKAGALCYKDCAKIGLINCGNGACSYSSEACALEVTDMTLQAIEGVYNGGTMVASMGIAGTPAKLVAAASSTMASAGSAGLARARVAFDDVKGAFQKEEYRTAMIANIKDAIRDKLWEGYVAQLSESQMHSIAVHVFNRYKAQMNRESDAMASNFAMQAYEQSGVKDVVDNCALAGTSTNADLACADAALEFMYWIDVTGLCGVAAAFIQPVCDAW